MIIIIMLNTIKLDASKLKSKQSLPDEPVKPNLPATRSIARMQIRLRQHLLQKQLNVQNKAVNLLNDEIAKYI